jgi:hypothetical protein
VDTQSFPPCKIIPSRVSFWEEVKVKNQIGVLITLGKMKPNTFEYACKVTLLVKKDNNCKFCGDYKLLNMQTHQDSFPMPLVEDVLTQLGKAQWFFALDLESRF